MKHENGFTLLEVLIAIAIFGIAFAVVLMILTAVSTASLTSGRQEGFEQVKNNLAVEFSNSVRWAKDVQVGGTTLTVDGLPYTLNSGRITKDGQPITPANITVTDFSVGQYSTVPGYSSVKIIIGLADTNLATITDSEKIVVSQRILSFEEGSTP